jgi:hypothetical protein
VQRILIIVLVLAAVAGAYLWFAHDDAVDTPELDPGAGPATAGKDKEKEGGTLKRATAKGPVPEVERKDIQGECRLLMLARGRSTWTATLENSFKRMRTMQYRTWYHVGVQGSEIGGPFAGEGRGLSELKQKPTAEFLRDHDIQVLVVDEIDPNAYPDLFWTVAAERIKSGAMGLYFRPGIPMTDDGQALSVHPALTHPTFSELLPIAKAREITGSPVPGVFTVRQQFAITPAGLTHPAMRLVEPEEASQAVWTAAGMGEGKLGTKFAYPVEELKPGALRLLDVETGVGLPAIVASGGPERVLWMGTNELGDRQTHFKLEKNRIQTTLLNHWWVWLMGQAE